MTVYDDKGQSTGKSVVLPAVFRAPIRTDIVNFVHDQMRRNKRQAHAVSTKAGSSAWMSAGSQVIAALLILFQVNKHRLNRGVPAVPSLVFLECVVVVLTDQVKVHSATCAVVVVCMLHWKSGENGTERSTWNNDAMLWSALLLLQVFHRLSLLEVSFNCVEASFLDRPSSCRSQHRNCTWNSVSSIG